MMTGRERILAALQRREPDRLPTMEWVLHPDVIEGVNGSKSAEAFVVSAGLDGIAVSLNYRKEKIDDRHVRDEWGVVRVTYDDYPNPVGHPVKSLDDLEKLVVPDPDAEERFTDIRNTLDRIGGETCVVARVKDVFSHPRDLMGFDDFLMAFYLQPDLVQGLMRMCVEHSTAIARNLKELGIEVIVIGDDIANNTGLLLSPGMYMEQVYPHFRELVGNFKDIGLYVIKHSDGDLRAVLEPLVSSGIDCLDPIDPLGSMDMAEVKAAFGDRIALKGNVDCVETLVNKDLDSVKKETLECILAGSAEGGHIISSSNSIHRGIDPVNYGCFLDTVKEWGAYPLDAELISKEAERLCRK